MVEAENPDLDYGKAVQPTDNALIRRVSKNGEREHSEDLPLSLLLLSALALGLGIVTGLGAVLFRDLIALLHNLFFNGTLSIVYDANVFTAPSRWGVFVIGAPVVGGIVVTFLVSNFAPEAKGHGVPEVMNAIYHHEGRIRPIVAVVKSLASAVAIGSGSSVGREGPIIQIGSALGSTLGQIIRMPIGQRIVMVAAGAGAGIAATFNTPIGGVMFAIELMMPEVSVSTFLPVAIATGAATFVGRWFIGQQPAFLVPPLQALTTDASAIVLLVLYTALGGLTGVAAAAFIRGLHLAEDCFDRIPGRYTRHILGMWILGLLMYVLFDSLGEYYVDGVGYATIESILVGHMTSLSLLALLFACKLIATSTSLGAGSSGGIFSPSLFMGATIGGGFAALVQMLGIPLPVSIPAFAMVGMGAMVGGGTGAVMTAITMTFEMTREYDIVMPMILAVATSVGVRRLLSRENIYTLKLVRRGQPIPKALHANMFLVRHAREVMDSDILVLQAEQSFDEFLRQHEDEGRLRHVVVIKGGHVFGVIRINTGLRRGLEERHTGVSLGDIASRDFTIVGTEMIASEVIQRIWRRNAFMAVVVGGHGVPREADVVGVITREHVANSVADGLKIYPR
ncbi:chloride channel protein [Rhizobium sp. P40RR-XXII]|uniref:chloride channel protein n=1 Tax=unclassified Rhizobium TaxID=2613769 RepID=UPI0014576125|nr:MULTISPECIES: chloride channel protein [unclassified Rhizobium]NLR89189.1 chloride channel protein [Rhizobium sp. P28RR-XV]NLS19077.1 chloride channel protein [Rhizobium sp. P40RR-XXII]